MIRDMKRSRAAYLLCILIVAIGFCGFTVLELCYDNLVESRDLFFSQSDFCGGFAEVTDSPVSEAGILESMPWNRVSLRRSVCTASTGMWSCILCPGPTER